ncbi:uncharacterized protein [Primulina eburnea]|uniref:uncharacterized protein isoform X1 n=2 Tax=Primulina eburnea TaxID=1245227 RepID=UPI003C6BFF7D
MAFLFKLVAKPLLLVILSCQFGLQCICVIIQTWIELLRAALYLHLVILWRSAIWVISVLSLPMRAISALYKEKMLHMQLHQVSTELEDVLWERRELEKQLHMSIKECRMTDVMLTELKKEHYDAIAQIELLGGEVRDLKDEIRRIKEVEGKSFWDDKGVDDETKGSYTENSINSRTSLPSRYGNISHGMSPEIIQNHDVNELMKTQPKSQWPIEQHAADIISKCNTVCDEQRDLALSQSVFSAILTLLVGMIVWEAKDPCMPLVLALFAVVAMSLSSVVQFFSTIQHKPTPDAVALLSFNWFMFGILMYPTLPMFARVSSPIASRFLGRTFNWLSS